MMRLSLLKGYTQMKWGVDGSLKLFIWLLALIPVAILHSQSLVQLLALLVALPSLLSPSLRGAFMASIRHHLKTFQGRFVVVVLLCFLPSIIFSGWPGAGVEDIVPFILVLLILTGLAGLIPLMEECHRRLFLRIIVWGLIISFLIFFLLYHPYYNSLPAQEGYWGTVQEIYNGRSPYSRAKAAVLHLALFFPILLFALWQKKPRRLFVIFLFLVPFILLLHHVKSRTAIAGIFVTICILGAGFFFLPSLSAKQKKCSLFLFLVAIMISAPIIITQAIEKQKKYEKNVERIISSAPKKPPPLGVPVSVIDFHRQILWLEYIRGWKDKPFLGFGVDSSGHEKKTAIRINHRYDIEELNDIIHLNISSERLTPSETPHPASFDSRHYYHHNYPFERLIKKGLISPQKLRIIDTLGVAEEEKVRITPTFLQFHPHNYYIQILFETGLIGFIPFMAFLIFLFSRTALIFWRSREMGVLFVLGLHGMFFTEGLFFPRFFSETALIMYGTAWMAILILGRDEKRVAGQL